MTTPVYEFPQAWYQFAKVTYRITSRSQVSNRTWLGGKSVYGPHAQMFVADFTMATQQDPIRQQIAAFFSRLDGQAGLLRIADPSRLRPWHDRNIDAALETWSDGSTWSDGTLWNAGYLPPDLYLIAPANKGDNFIQVGGLPASLAGALTRGDLIQLKPNGIPGSCPNNYEIMVGGPSNAAGQIGIEVRPRLRMGFAAGDQASLRYASTVFRLIDDDQGAVEVTPPVLGNLGFSLIEALDQVP